ncbi:MAG: hypothetical protein JXM70_00645 [Pirellulales bacterium]|nr:hypothetical protein [Pirellulales bacterium]
MECFRSISMLVVLSVASSLTGCGGNPLNRQAVSGEVKLDGVSLDQGTIEFRPTQRKGTVSSGAVIRDGKYNIETQKGLPPGEYRVMIFSAAADKSPIPAGPPGSGSFEGHRPTIERIPPQYNTKTEQIVEITDGGSNRFSYDIKTK